MVIYTSNPTSSSRASEMSGFANFYFLHDRSWCFTNIIILSMTRNGLPCAKDDFSDMYIVHTHDWLYRYKTMFFMDWAYQPLFIGDGSRSRDFTLIDWQSHQDQVRRRWTMCELDYRKNAHDKKMGPPFLRIWGGLIRQILLVARTQKLAH